MNIRQKIAFSAGLISTFLLTACGSGTGSTTAPVPPVNNPTSLTTLYSLGTNASDPKSTITPLIQGSDGNMYGVSATGGANNLGALFQVTPSGTVSIVYSFGGHTYDGTQPAGLIQATDGNFYGTTANGGTNGTNGSGSCANVILACLSGNGTVFKITLKGVETVLYSFGSSATDGINPNGGMIQASDGYFYGTTSGGGTNRYGSVFKISGTGTESVIYSFGANSSTDATFPNSGLVQSGTGTLYGTSTSGGLYGKGSVYQITSYGTESLLYSFGSTSNDGTLPYANVILGSDGNLYGTTISGGAQGVGTVFKVTPAGSGSTLYAFGSSATDGSYPYDPLVQASDGNFYGTTYSGGANGVSLCAGSTTTCHPGYGTIFMMTPSGTEKVLYSFGASASTGLYPVNGLLSKNGVLYGATTGGGAYGNGTIYSFVN